MNQSIIAEIPKWGAIRWPYVQPPIFQSLWFEKFNVDYQKDWMAKNFSISFCICAVYLVLVFSGKEFMKNRKAFELRRTNALWNFGFMCFSILGFVRCLPELVYVLLGNEGFHRSVCVRDAHNEPVAFWGWVFTLSKIVELGDTAFMVLRKKPVYPVHYVHHGLALIICWSLYPLFEPVLRYSGTYNFFLHSILYGFLFLKTIDVTMPKYFSKMILLLEMLQLIIGLVLNVYATWIKAKGQPCEHRTDVIIVETLFYCTYGAVLVNYFIKSINRARAKIEKKL